MMNELSDEQLAKQRILFLTSELDRRMESSIKYLLTSIEIQASSTKPIRLIIDCVGGNVEAALALFDFFESLHSPIHGIVFGECSSAALIVLQGCTKRFAAKHSRFSTHLISLHINMSIDDYAHERINQNIRRSKELKRYVETIMVNRTGLERKDIRRIVAEGEKNRVYLSADSAKRLGFIDEVITDYPLFSEFYENT